MSGSTTPYYSFNLPTIGGNQDSWGNLLNANWTAADSAIHGLASGYLPLVGGGTITGNLSITGNLFAGGATVTALGQISALSFVSENGALYVSANPQNYLGRSSTDAAWRFVENGTTNLSLDTSGNLTARGAVHGSNVTALEARIEELTARVADLEALRLA